ncbi:methyl-accepting chemotaxis protein [Parachlamydia acanthamoebae]|nr:methyl-accepting chemotaxis protein [Parachlamydia acanthamoebae]
MGHFFLRFSSKFTYLQKLIVIATLIFLSLAISLYYNWQFFNQKIERLENQQLGNQSVQLIRRLLENISRHVVMLSTMQYEQDIYQNDIIQMQAQISSDFRKLGLGTFKNPLPILAPSSSDLLNSESNELTQNWNLFLENVQDNNQVESIDRFKAIMDRLQLRMLYMGIESTLIQSEDVPYFLTNLAFIELPKGQSLIAQFVMLNSEKMQKKTLPNKDQKRLELLKSQLEDHLRNLSVLSESANINKNVEIKNKINRYAGSIHNLISEDEHHVGLSKNKKTFSWFSDKGIKALRESSLVWDTSFEEISRSLKEYLEHIENIKNWVIGISTALALAAFLITFLCILQVWKPMEGMIHTLQKFKAGDLSLRMPVMYQDEIGAFAILCNQVGDKFEETFKQFEKTGNVLTNYSDFISDASKQLESTAVEQEITSKQIAVTAKEIAATAKEFSNTLNTISSRGEETSTLANSGMEGLAKMENTMQQMIEASTNITSKLAVLSDKAQTITNIITTISKVAQQTNLLSLNAAIEAEKAGEHGRSFAVISREIRRLAEQTAFATVDIEKMINEMVSAVASSVMGVDKFSDEIYQGVSYVRTVGEQLTQIIEQVQKQMISFENVNIGMQNQVQGASQITEAINQWSESAQQVTNSIRRFHQTIDQLAQTNKQMHDVIKYIKAYG